MDTNAYTIKMYTLTQNETYKLRNKDLIHRHSNRRGVPQQIAEGTIKQENKGAITPKTGVEHQPIIAVHHSSHGQG